MKFMVENTSTEDAFSLVVTEYRPTSTSLTFGFRYYLYMLIRFLYVSMYYYFLPFVVIIYNYSKVFTLDETKVLIVFVPGVNG